MFKKSTILFLSILLTGVIACRLPKSVPPKMIDENFKNLNIKSVGMLPMADLRQDASKPFKHADYLRKWLGKNMDIRGYASSYTGGNQNITLHVANEATLLAYDASIESFLGDKKFRFVFLPVLTETSKEGFVGGKTSKINILGIVFDKEQKKVVWMNQAAGEDTGFAGMSALTSILSVDNAIGNLMAGMPKAKK